MNLRKTLLIVLAGLLGFEAAQAAPYFPAQGKLRVKKCEGLAIQNGDTVQFEAGPRGIAIRTTRAGVLKAENNGAPAFGSNGGFYGWLRNEPVLYNGELTHLFYMTIRGYESPAGVLAPRGEKVVVLHISQSGPKTILLSGSTDNPDISKAVFECVLENEEK